MTAEDGASIKLPTFDQKAKKFADTWIPVFSGKANPAKIRQFAVMVGEKNGFTEEASGRLSKSFAPFLLEEGFCPRTLFRVGLFFEANLNALKNCSEPLHPVGFKEDIWCKIHVVDLIPTRPLGERRKKVWNVVCLVLGGINAGVEFTTVISDSYLTGIIRNICGAKYCKTLAGCDIFNMRMKAMVGTGKSSVVIKVVDDSYKYVGNARLRLERQECPHGPCDRCPKGLDQCPNAVKRSSINVNRNKEDR